MDNLKKLEDILAHHQAALEDVRAQCSTAIVEAGEALIEALEQGATVFTCGNGGSAADAQHFSAELVGRFVSKTRRPLPSVALTVDSSALTSIGNDFGFEAVFVRQVEALARAGDVLVGISTSGRSGNVLAAMEKAHTMGLTCIGLAGADGSAMAPYCKRVVAVPHPETARVQEMHITIIHAWCQMIDDHFGGR